MSYAVLDGSFSAVQGGPTHSGRIGCIREACSPVFVLSLAAQLVPNMEGLELQWKRPNTLLFALASDSVFALHI